MYVTIMMEVMVRNAMIATRYLAFQKVLCGKKMSDKGIPPGRFEVVSFAA